MPSAGRGSPVVADRPDPKRPKPARAGGLACCVPGCRLGLTGALLATAAGCVKPLPPEGSVIEQVRLTGAQQVSADRVLEGLVTRPSDQLLSMSGLVGEYVTLDESLLRRDLDRVVSYYRARGHYEARVVAARVVELAPRHVAVTIAVEEGPRVRIDSQPDGRFAVQLHGLEAIADASLVARLIALSPSPGEPFDEGRYDTAKRRLLGALRNAGFAFATVTGHVQVDLVSHSALVDFDIQPGPRATFGPVRLLGLKTLPRAPIEANLVIAPGASYSEEAVLDARRALVNLGVLSSVSVRIDRSAPESRQVPVTFEVQEAAPRTVRLGGGLRLDALELGASALASWEHRNFLGGLRHLTLEARPGAVLLPTRVGSLVAPTAALFETSFGASLVQPAIFGGRTRGFARAAANLHPLLYTNTSADEPIVGFLELRNVVGLERALWGHRLHLTPSLTVRSEIPVDYSGLALGESPERQAPSLETLLIVYPELSAALDLRDNPLEPRQGLWLSNSVQWAARRLGSNVADVRVRPEVRAYASKGRSTLALRGTLGLLLPRNYAAPALDAPDGTATSGAANEALRDFERRLLFRGFFSGGALSNRGYAYQGVGPHDELSGLLGRCPAGAEPSCVRPTGGLSLWEASAELRLRPRALAPLGLVLFVDASDVRQQRLRFSLNDPHLSPGIGVRYATPVGPLRLDLGYRLLEKLGAETPLGQPPRLFGEPVTLHLALGEAF